MTSFVPGQTLTAAELNAAFAATGTGTVTEVVVSGGPFLTAADIKNSGTVTGSASSLTASAILLGAGTGAVSSLGSLGTSTTVLHGNAAGSPSFSAVDLAADTTGTLAVAKGGTGLGAVGFSGGVLAYVAAGTLASSAVLAADHLVVGGGAGFTPATLGSLGSANQVLLSAGAGNPPAFGNLSLTDGTNTVQPLTSLKVAGAAVTGTTPNGTITVTGASGIEFTDGTNDVTGATKLTITGGTVGGTTPNATLTITGASGVTSVITQGGPFLANTTITSTGTINNAVASLTPHGVVLGEGTSAAAVTAAGTDGQLLIATTNADPAFTSVSGDATITKAGVITVTKIGGVTPATVANFGAVLNSGTVQVNNVTTLTGTAAGTLTLAATTGTSDIVINMPASGGTVTLAAAPTFKRQRYEVDIVQGATAGSVVLNSGFVFGTSGGPAAYTATPTAAAVDRLMMISPDGTKLAVLAVAQGFTI